MQKFLYDRGWRQLYAGCSFMQNEFLIIRTIFLEQLSRGFGDYYLSTQVAPLVITARQQERFLRRQQRNSYENCDSFAGPTFTVIRLRKTSEKSTSSSMVLKINILFFLTPL